MKNIKIDKEYSIIIDKPLEYLATQVRLDENNNIIYNDFWEHFCLINIDNKKEIYTILNVKEKEILPGAIFFNNDFFDNFLQKWDFIMGDTELSNYFKSISAAFLSIIAWAADQAWENSRKESL